MFRASSLSKWAVFGFSLIACQDERMMWDSGFSVEPPIDGWGPIEMTPSWESSDGGYATGLGLGDMDGDGDLDVVVAIGNDMRPSPVVVYENGVNGVESAPSFVTEHERYHGHLSLGDMNGDGWIDAAVSVYLGDSGWGEPGGVDLYFNDGGRLPEFPSFSITGLYSFSNALGDFDLDGDLDLAIAVGEPYTSNAGQTAVYINDGSGGFGAEPEWTTPEVGFTLDVAWVDVNADGYLDLALANHGTPRCIHGRRALIEPGTILAGLW